MKKLFGLILVVFSSICFADVSLYATATTDYVSRGVSYSNNGPAVQGGSEYTMPIGAMLGVWTTTLGDNTGGQELDFYAGYKKEVLENFTVGGKIISYRYLKNTSSDYLEGNINFSYQIFKLDIYYAPEVPVAAVTETYKNLYFNLSASIEIMKDISIGTALGYSHFNNKTLADSNNRLDGVVSLIKTIQDTTISLNLSDTNRKNAAGEKQKDQSLSIAATINI